jgi:hypothetical protein
MGAPLGNQNAVKAKRWYQAIDRALAKRSKGDAILELDRLAEIYLDTIEQMTIPHGKSGPSIAGLADLRDTLDGKPKQQVELQGDADQPLVHKIIREVVGPGPAPGAEADKP